VLQVTGRGPARLELSTGGAPETVVGGAIQLSAVGYTEVNDPVRGVAVRWRSLQPAVAEVSSAGLVTGKAPGKATLVAESGGVSGRIDVTVRPNPVRSIAITPPAEPVRTGDVVTLTAALRDARGQPVSGVPVRWSVSGQGAAVGDGGRFVASAPGTYALTATVGSVSGASAVRVAARSDPRQVVQVAHAALPNKDMQTAEVWPVGDVAYLSTIAGTLYVFDITNPAAPRLTDSLMVDARIINDVSTTKDGKIGVLTREGASTRKNGLVFFDASDPRHPKKLSEFTETVTGGVHSAFVYEHYVFATDDATGSLRIIDFADPRQPKQIARWEVPRAVKQVEVGPGESIAAGRYLHDVYVDDGLAYLAYWKDGLIILDVGKGIKGGSITAPKLVSQFTYNHAELYPPDFLAGTHAVFRSGRYVFLGDEVLQATFDLFSKEALVTHGMLHVVDVSDIEHPKKVAQWDPVNFGVHNLWADGGLLYIGAYDGGIRVVDVSGELMGDLGQQGRVFGALMTRSLDGYRPNQALTWSAIPHKGYVYASDINTGLWVAKVTGGVVP
jgi:hypothetical protein